MNFHWIYLSHQLNKNHFSYGNGKRIDITVTNSIKGGDSSNNTVLSLPTHFATHIDFPYHFDNSGKQGDDYPPDYYISNKIQLVDKSKSLRNDYYFKKKDFSNIDFISETEILVIKTGMGDYLHKDEYWNSNPGFAPELASYFKSKMPNVRIIGFDAISLTGRKYRKEGKTSHYEFLVNNNMLILEDMDLSALKNNSFIKKIIIAPLRFKNADGAPATVFAKVVSNK